MLDRLVRPLVRTQVQVLAKTPSAHTRLMGMVSQWLGYLGVQADVTHLKTNQGRIQIALAVGKPEQCTENEWSKILENIEQNNDAAGSEAELTYQDLSKEQKSKVHRLLAGVIQAGNKDAAESWDTLQPQLIGVGMNQVMLANIRSAMKVPTMMDSLLKDLEPEVAAYVLSKAISIALIDKEINQEEDNALKAIYEAIEHKAGV
ncbi:MAG: hypothetical protein ACFB2W_16295 [Leptolyngbyaceae cyanobacterium]